MRKGSSARSGSRPFPCSSETPHLGHERAAKGVPHPSVEVSCSLALIPEVFACQESCAEFCRVVDRASIERPRVPGEVGCGTAVPTRGLAQSVIQGSL
jgi:hypothetical protein